MSAPGPVGEPVLLISAGSPAALTTHLQAGDDALIAAAAATREPVDLGDGGPCRLAVAAPTPKNLALARRVVRKGAPWRGRNDVWFSTSPLLDGAGTRAGKVAFLFPGLEGEFAPNLADVADWLVTPVPPTETSSIGTHAASALRVGRLLDSALRRLEIRPDVVAGHSVGEWNAMSAGGMFTADELSTMIRRADLDSMAVPDVDFGVVGWPAERVRARLAGRESMFLSHENSTNQTVVCGPPSEVAALLEQFRSDGAICQVLPFRSGFHTPMLAPHLAFFRQGLAELRLRAAAVPVWSAATAAPFPDDPAGIRELCVRHLLEPVRFRDTVLGMHDAGARVFVQVGAGQLASLVADTLRDRDHLTVAANSRHRAGLAQLQRVAAALWVEGGGPRFVGAAEPLPVGGPPCQPPPFAGFAQLAAGSPVARELAALLSEMAELATTVLDAEARPSPPADDVLRISTARMPYLLDHCFVPQRAGWPDEGDRRPVVPGTTVVTHLIQAAEARSHGRRARGVDNARLKRWLLASPALDVPIETGPAGPGRLRVALGGYADAEVVFDEPAAAVPQPWPAEAGERTPTLTAREVYEQRWLFHGDAFRVLHTSVGMGPRTARARLTVTEVPGALLDGIGQVLGLWLFERARESWLAFPVRIRRLRQHAPLPPPGSLVDCTVRITAMKGESIEADAQVCCDGQVLISIQGWTDRLFDCSAEDAETYRFPERHTLADRQPDGSWLARDRWSDLASRGLWVQRYLAAGEHAAFEVSHPRERMVWLLTRIAIKDAVRAVLWAADPAPVFPAELTVVPETNGWTVRGTHGLVVPDLHITVTTEPAGVRATARPASTAQHLVVPTVKELVP